MLRIRGLTKRYRTGDLAVKGIDLDVPDGQVMALIGPSGAGKSTVIRCINRLVEGGQQFEYRMTIKSRDRLAAERLSKHLRGMPDVIEFRIAPTGD